MDTSAKSKRPKGNLRRFALAPLLVLLALSGLAAGDAALTQGSAVALVNAEREFVERKKDGGLTARPIFDRRLQFLYYGLRDIRSGDWLTGMYRVQGGERELDSGWEYTFDYPKLDGQPELDPERVYLLVVVASPADGSDPGEFSTLVPVYQPTGLWDRVLRAFNPETWARAILVWVIQGVHGGLCTVLEKISGGAAANCREV